MNSGTQRKHINGLNPWEALLEASPLAIVGLTPDGRVLLWNTAAEKIFGWMPEEVIGKPLPNIPESGQEEFRILLESQLQGIPDRGRSVVRLRKDGSTINLKLWSAPMRDKDGRINGKLAILADTTEADHIEAERCQLIASERDAREEAVTMGRFRELLESAPDAIIEVDAHGNIALVNAATEQMFGYGRDELVGQSVELLIPQEMRQVHVDHRNNYRNAPSTRPMGSGLKLEAQRKDGTRFPVEISLSPVHHAESFRVSAIIRDVTDRHKTEEQFREMQTRFAEELSATNNQLEIRSREAEQANRLKSEFLASMSHELRTPLHTIIGFSELLGEELEGSLNDKQKRFVTHIHKDSLHLLELINDILDLSKIEAGRLEMHLEVFDAIDAVKEVLESITPLASSKGMGVEPSGCSSLMLRADRVRFKQILFNLLSNAVKFTPEGGRVSVECSNGDGWAVFCVSDTGIGIPEHEQKAIFDKFHQVGSTTRGVREGTGLGLAITKHLIEVLGGKIWLESQPGGGSRFSFRLPPEHTR